MKRGKAQGTKLRKAAVEVRLYSKIKSNIDLKTKMLAGHGGPIQEVEAKDQNFKPASAI